MKKLVPLALLLAFMTLGSHAQDTSPSRIDPREIAKLVEGGLVKFDPDRAIVVTLETGESYTIEPVHTADQSRYLRIPENSFKALQGPGRLPPLPPLPPRPWPPLPSPDHGGKPPPKPPTPGVPVPVPPKPPQTPPKPPPKPQSMSLVEESAGAGVIVGRLTTEGISSANGSLAKGSYTIVLTTYNGKPFAALIDSQGNYVLSSTNFFLVDAPQYQE